MSMIHIENLSFTYPSSYDPVFDHASFLIDTDWKLGFVGRNGKGKTTLLLLLLGKYPYKGKITSSVPFDYFPYPVPDKSRLTQDILEEICPLAQEWELHREMNLLDVDTGVLWRPFETLSNGEQTKVLLAALFLNEGHFLLIDEPTNHLDADARKKVSAYLKKKKGFILVSHDRRFLDGCVDHILALNRSTIDVQKGNFSTWMENFERQQMFEEGQNERLKKEIAQLKQSARRTAAWSDKVEKEKHGTNNSGSKLDKGYVGHKAAKLMQRSKAMEARRRQAIEQKSSLLKNTETADTLSVRPLTYHGDRLVSFTDVAVCYENGPVCKPVSFDIRRGDRIVLDGRNGSGKSSLIKLLAGFSKEHTGQVSIGSGLIISYVPQDASQLAGSLSGFAKQQQIDETLFKSILRKLGFERIQFEKDMAALSAGQKKKIQLAKSLCQQAHLYVWDEPLNYIDVYSRMQIEELIRAYAPTALLVEHDEAFRDSVATQIIRID